MIQVDFLGEVFWSMALIVKRGEERRGHIALVTMNMNMNMNS
jgi:hypothetical protein